MGLNQPVLCLQITQEVLALAAGNKILIYSLDVLSERIPPLASVDIEGRVGYF